MVDTFILFKRILMKLFVTFQLMQKGGMEVIDCNNHVKSAIKYFGPSCAVNSLIDKYNPIGMYIRKCICLLNVVHVILIFSHHCMSMLPQAQLVMCMKTGLQQL